MTKTFERDGDYWVIRDVFGNEHARFETNKGIAELLVMQWRTALVNHGEQDADWFLHGICQGVVHCTNLCMETGLPLGPYVAPPPQPPES